MKARAALEKKYCWIIVLFLLTFVPVMALYVKNMLPTVGYHDTGNFQFTAYTLGIPHPTGYPLYMILGKIFTYLPVGDIAYRVNLMSAFFAALSALLVAVIVYLTTKDYTSSIGAGIIFSLGKTIWSRSLHAEVYSTTTFLYGLTILIVLLWINQRDKRLIYLGSLVYGLSMGVLWSTMLLFAPALLFVLVFSGRGGCRKNDAVYAFIFFLIGLSVYAYIPLRDVEEDYNYIYQLNREYQFTEYDGDFENSLYRSLYFSSGKIIGSHVRLTRKQLRDGCMRYWDVMKREYNSLYLFISALGLIFMLFKRTRLAAFLMLLYVFTIVGYSLMRSGDWRSLSTPSYFVIAVFFGFALHSIKEAVPLMKSKPRKTLLNVIVLLLIVLLAKSLYDSNHVDRSGNFNAYRYGESVFKTIEPNSVILSTWAHSTVLWYFSYVVYPEMNITVSNMVKSNWISEVDKNFGVRPVYMISDCEDVKSKYRIAKECNLFKVNEPFTPVFSDKGGEIELIEYSINHKVLGRGEPMTLKFRWRCRGKMVGDYQTYVHFRTKNFLKKKLRTSFGGDHYPNTRTTQWKCPQEADGEIEAVVPLDILPGRYRITVGWYGKGGKLRTDINTNYQIIDHIKIK